MRDALRWLTRTVNEATGSKFLRRAINAKIQEYAEVLNLQIDSAAKTIRAEVKVKGQSTPVQLEILDYSITEEAGLTKLSWSTINVAAGSIDLPPGLKDKLEFVL